MKILDIKNLTPDIYSQESRDFQLLANLYSVIVNGVKFDSDNILRTVDTNRCRAEFLDLLATKLGFFTKKDLNSEQLRSGLMGFKDLIKKKGTLTAIAQAVNVFLKSLGIHNKVKIALTTEDLVFSGRLIKNRTVIISIESPVSDTSLLDEIFRYILPAGYEYEITFYLEVDPYDEFEFAESVQLIYVSDDINSTAKGASGPLVKQAVDTIEVIGGKETPRDLSTQAEEADVVDLTTIPSWTTQNVTSYYVNSHHVHIEFTGSDTFAQIANWNVANNYFIPGNTYTISYTGSGTNMTSARMAIVFYNGATFISEVDVDATTGTVLKDFTVPTSTTKLAFVFRVYASDAGDYDFSNFRVDGYGFGYRNILDLTQYTYQTQGLASDPIIKTNTITEQGSGTAWVQTYFNISSLITPGKTYTFRGKATDTTVQPSIIVGAYDGSTSIAIYSLTLSEEESKTFTAPANANTFKLYLRASSSTSYTGEQTLYDIQIEEGSVAHGFVPYEGLKVKNILDLTQYAYTTQNLQAGVTFTTNTSTQQAAQTGSSVAFPQLVFTVTDLFVPGQTYTFQGKASETVDANPLICFLFYKTDGTQVECGLYLRSQSSRTFTVPLGISRVILILRNDQTKLYEGVQTFYDMMLEEGSVAHDFVPYAVSNLGNFRGICRTLTEIEDPQTDDIAGVIEGKNYYMFSNNSYVKKVFAGKYASLTSIPDPIDDSIVHLAAGGYYHRNSDAWEPLTLRGVVRNIEDAEFTNLGATDLVIADRVSYYRYFSDRDVWKWVNDTLALEEIYTI